MDRRLALLPAHGNNLSLALQAQLGSQQEIHFSAVVLGVGREKNYLYRNPTPLLPVGLMKTSWNRRAGQGKSIT